MRKLLARRSLKQFLKVNKGVDYRDIDMLSARAPASYREIGGRGMLILNSSNLRSFTGKKKDGSYQTATTEMPLYYLNAVDRAVFARLCAPVFAVITARMNKISALEWNVISKSKSEDRLAERLKGYKDLYNELKSYSDPRYAASMSKAVLTIKRELPDVLPDLRNFDSCLMRWKRDLDWERIDRVDEITDWIRRPFREEKFSEIAKKIVFDLMVHSAASVYKYFEGDDLKYYSLLPGGTVIKIKTRFASNLPEASGYIQILDNGYINPQIMYNDELSFMEYLPITLWNIQLIPLEALINKCLEYIETDNRMKNEADGQKPPEKLIIILNDSPGGDMIHKEGKPVDDKDIRRLEKKLQKGTKSRAITYTGSKAEVVDLGDSGSLSDRLSRQKDIKEDIGLVFGATPMELNMTGSADTSGRNTSEAQADIFFGRGIAPFVKSIEEYFTDDIIYYKYKTRAYMLEAERGQDDEQELKLDLLRLQTGELTQNELRGIKNKSVFPGEQYNLPAGAGDMERGTDLNPMVVQDKKI